MLSGYLERFPSLSPWGLEVGNEMVGVTVSRKQKCHHAERSSRSALSFVGTALQPSLKDSGPSSPGHRSSSWCCAFSGIVLHCRNPARFRRVRAVWIIEVMYLGNQRIGPWPLSLGYVKEALICKEPQSCQLNGIYVHQVKVANKC